MNFMSKLRQLKGTNRWIPSYTQSSATFKELCQQWEGLLSTFPRDECIDRVHWDVNPKGFKHGEEGLCASIWNDGS